MKTAQESSKSELSSPVFDHFKVLPRRAVTGGARGGESPPRFIFRFFSTKGRRRLKLSHKTYLDVPDLFSDPYFDQLGEKTSKTLIFSIFLEKNWVGDL